MNFQELLSRLNQIETQPTVEVQAQECGDMPTPMNAPMNAPMSQPDTPPPSMSINLNAQGLDNIEELMKLIKAVNPDMDKPEMPPIGMTPPGMPSMGSVPSLPPLKMLPDLDNEPADDMPGPDIMNKPDDGDDGVNKAHGDIDNDGDHDMDDHDMEKDKEDEPKKDEWANSPNGVEADPEVKDVDSVIMKGNDLHKSKGTYPKVAGADNPRQPMESGDLRSQIRSQLLKALAESKK